uniref:Uncharacterized protein n=1 Tax=viral metagenome TaxID=1070528 RepID=A0A6H1ZE27_9ZZZZ
MNKAREVTINARHLEMLMLIVNSAVPKSQDDYRKGGMVLDIIEPPHKDIVVPFFRSIKEGSEVTWETLEAEPVTLILLPDVWAWIKNAVKSTTAVRMGFSRQKNELEDLICEAKEIDLVKKVEED